MNRRQIEPVLDSLCGVRETHIAKAISAGRTNNNYCIAEQSVAMGKGPGTTKKTYVKIIC